MIIIKKSPDSNRSKRWIKYNDFSLDSVKFYVLNILSDYPLSFKFNKNNSKLFIKFNDNCNFSPWKNIFNDIMNNILC